LQINNWGGLIPTLTYTSEWSCTCDPIQTIENLTVCDIKFEKDINVKVDLQINNWGGLIPTLTYTDISGNTQTIEKTFKDFNNQGLKLEEDTSVSYLGYVETVPGTIVSAVLKQNHNAECIKTTNYTLSITDPIITTECKDGAVSVRVIETSSKITGVEFLNNGIFYDAGVIQGGIGVLGENFTQNKDIAIKVTFEGNCIKEYTTKANCCEQDGLLITSTSDFENKKLKTFTVKTTFGQNIIGSTIKINGQSVTVRDCSSSAPNTPTVGRGQTSDICYKFDFEITENTQYTITASTENECDYSFPITFTETEDDNTLSILPSIICENDQAALVLETNSPNASYTVVGPNNTYTRQTDINGSDSFNINDAGTYTLQLFDGENVSISKTLDVVPKPQINSFTKRDSKNIYCKGDNIIFDIQGTAGAVIVAEANNIALSPITLNSSGSGSFTFSATDIGQIAIVLVSAASGSCERTLSNTIILQVANSPVIVSLLDTCVMNPINGDVNISITVNGSADEVKWRFVEDTNYTNLNNSNGNEWTGLVTQGSNKSIEVVASNAANCSAERTFNLENCLCPFVEEPEEKLEESCNNNPILISYPVKAGFELEWYEFSNLFGTFTKIGINEWSKSLIYQAGIIYKVRHISVTSQCTSDYSDLFINNTNITSVDILPSADSNVNNPSVGEQINLLAQAIPSSNANWNYQWYVNNILQSTSSDLFTYTPVDTIPTNIRVVVTSNALASCSAENTITITAINNCSIPSISIINSTSQCENPAIVVDNLNGNDIADITYEWYETTSMTILSTNSELDISSLGAGTILNLRARAYVSGLPTCYAELPLNFTKCGCLCSPTGNCSNSLTVDSNDGFGGFGEVFNQVFSNAQNVNIKLGRFTTALSPSDRFRVRVISPTNVTTQILDTGYPYYNYSANSCSETNGYPIVDLDVNGNGNGSDITSLMPVANGITVFDLFRHSVQFDYTVPAGYTLIIEHNDVNCANQQGWSASVRCTS